MTVDLPRDVARRLPDDLAPEAVTACLSLTGGLSEAHVVATDDRLIGLVKRSALDGLELIELDRSKPPQVAVVSWQDSLVLEAADGSTVPVPLPTMDKARTRAGIAALYGALGAWSALAALYGDALAETRGRSERLVLLAKLAEIGERVDPPTAVAHYRAMIALDPRSQVAVAGLQGLHAVGLPAAIEPLLTAHRARGEWDRVVALLAEQAREATDPADRSARWAEVAELAGRRLDDPAQAIAALGRALAIRFDPGHFDRLDRLVTATGSWAAGAAALVEATAGEGAPLADLWRRVAVIRGDRLGQGDAAIAAWEQVHAADPTAEDALLALAEVHRRAERWGPFLYTSRRALKLTGDLAARIRLLRGIAEVEQGPCERRDAAIEAWEALLAIAVYDPVALDALEALYAETERWAELATLLDRRQRVAEAALDHVGAIDLLRRRARLVDSRLDDMPRAITLWREVRSRVPGDAEADTRLDALLTRSAQWAPLEALLGIRAAGLDGSARAEVHRRRALILAEHLADPDRAVGAWRAVLIDLPGDRQALDALVAFYREQDRLDDLVGALEALARVLPPDSPLRIDTWAELGRTLPRVGRSGQDTIAAWRNVLAGRAEHREGLDALIGLYRASEQVTEAIPLLKRKAGITGAVADRLLLGELMTVVNAFDGAAEIYARILADDPDCAAARRFLEHYYSERARWADLIGLLQRTTAAVVDPARQLDGLLRIADLYLTRVKDPHGALDTLAAAPGPCFREKRLTDAALRAAAAGGDWQRFLDEVQARAEADAAHGATMADGARAFAGGLLQIVRGDGESACQLAAWFESHDAPDRAVECYDAALTADRTAIRAWVGKQRALGVARRWRMLVQHLDAMARAPLPVSDRIEALRQSADVLTRHINAPDEAAEALERAKSLARPVGRWILVAMALAFGAAIGFWVHFMLTR